MRNVGVRANPADVANQQDIARWSFGTGNPNDAAGAQGDYYVGSDNKLWSKGATTWTFTGVQYGSSAAVPAKTVPVDADILSLGDSANGYQMRQLTWANMRAALPVREKLSAARTYYVRTDGSDSNSGLSNSAAGAFLTIQKAVDVAASLDLGGFDVTINVGSGTWTSPTFLRTITGAGKINIKGINNNTTDTVISTTSANCFGDEFFGRYHFEWLKLQTVNSGACIFVQGSGILVTWANINFGQCAGQHLLVANGAQIKAVGPYQISGGASAHIATYDVCTAYCVGIAIAISNNPAFSIAFLIAERNCSVVFVQVTISGTATGSRYRSAFSSSVVTNGGESYLPGSSAGVRETGGQYS